MNYFFIHFQHDNTRLRTRIKALDETIDILRKRSVELQQELATYKISLADVPPGSDLEKDNIVSVVQGYLQELESLR